MIDVAPIPTPLTMPLSEPIAAIDVLPLVHVPPATELERVIVALIQTDPGPVIGPGLGLTVTIVNVEQEPTV